MPAILAYKLKKAGFINHLYSVMICNMEGEVNKMASKTKKVELNDDEMKTIIGVLKFASENCPIETASNEVDISEDKVKNLIMKLENSLKTK